MATSTKETWTGRTKQVAGKAKETTSKWLGDRRTAKEGRQEQRHGKMQEWKGKAKGSVKKLVDKF